MSNVYIQRLRTVRNEYDASREAISYVIRNWQKLNIGGDIAGVTPKHFSNAAESLEAVFTIRLFSTFEGVLNEHLSKNHPSLTVPDDAKSIWLINRVANRQTPHIGHALVLEVQRVRMYRNFLVHSSGRSVNPIIFMDALATLAKFCDKLPDPPH